MPTAAERDAAILRGFLDAVAEDAGLGDRLVSRVAQDLVAHDARWAPLAAGAPTGPDASALERIEDQAEGCYAALSAIEKIHLKRLARDLVESPNARGAEGGASGMSSSIPKSGELARAALNVVRSSDAPVRSVPGQASPSPDRAPSTGSTAAFKVACFGILAGISLLVLMCGGILALSPGRIAVSPPRPPRRVAANPAPPNGGRSVTQLDQTGPTEPAVPRTPAEREAAVVGALRAISAAEVLARDRDPAHEGPLRYKALPELSTRDRLGPAFAPRGERHSYKIECSPSTTEPQGRFFVLASPLTAASGTRWFFTNHSGEVLAASGPFVVDKETCELKEPFPPAAELSTGDADRARLFADQGKQSVYTSQWLSAIEPLETSLTLNPTNVEAWANLGKAYLELGSSDKKAREDELPTNVLLDRAEATLLHGVDSAQGRAASLHFCENNLGLLFLKRGEDAGRLPSDKVARTTARRDLAKSAALHFERALASEADYEPARINGALALLRQADASDPEDRRALGEKALALLAPCEALKHPTANTKIAKLSLGLAHRAAGHSREAVTALLPILEAGAGSADEGTAAALREVALALSREVKAPIAADDRALLQRSSNVLSARGRTGARGTSIDEDAAKEIEAHLNE